VLVAPGVVAFGGTNMMCVFTMRTLDNDCYAMQAPDGFDPASIPVVSGGVMVIGGSDGSVTAIDVARHKILWGKVLPTPVLDARLVISEGVVLLADWTRVPWAFRIADGSTVKVPVPEGFVIATATDPAGGFAVAIRADVDGRVERWLPQR
jgi:outer membrane protein assembly factor BamB